MPFAPSAYARWLYSLENQSPTHRDNTSALLRAGRFPEIGVANRAVHAEVRPIEQIEDVRAIDKSHASVSTQIELFHDRDVLREDRWLPESAHELRSVSKLKLARNIEGS